jgi:RNA polymerase sigma-70 factor (ECF subfamily)
VVSEVAQPGENARIIVSLIQQGDARGEEILYSVMSRGMKYLAMHKLGPEDGLECFHDMILVLISRIREGALQEPAALFGYARTILMRSIMDQFEKRRRHVGEDFDSVGFAIPDSRSTPHELMEQQQRVATMRKGLLALRPKEREVLTRFYLEEQSPERIQREMKLTDTQYRLLKSRSKQKLEQITAKAMENSKIDDTAAVFPHDAASRMTAGAAR